MAELLTIEQFKQMFGEIDTPSADTQIKRPLGVSIRRVKSWVGEEVFTAAVNADDDDETKLDLQAAAGYLAMHFLIANFNTVVRLGGIVKTEKVEGNAFVSYLVPSETSARSQEFFELADEMCRPWKLAEIPATVETIIDEC